MTKLVSLNNSGESLEKGLALYNTALTGNEEFYNNYDIDIYYGHNLPKITKGLNSHGTVGFYQEFLSNEPWGEFVTESSLWNNRITLLDKLVNNKHITARVANKMMDNKELYFNIINKMPLDYIYPEFIDNIIKKSKQIFTNVTFKPLKLEENFIQIYNKLPENKDYCSIYCLDSNGIVGHHYFHFGDCKYSSKKEQHMLNDLSRKSVLSGNSGILLTEINYLSDSNDIIGYRNHSRSPRPNRDFALNEMLKEKEGIIEPKNKQFGAYFANIDSTLNTEAQANIALGEAYKDYLHQNEYSLKLK